MDPDGSRRWFDNGDRLPGSIIRILVSVLSV